MDVQELNANLLIILVTFALAAYFVAAEFALVQTRASQLEDLISQQGQTRKLTRSLYMVRHLNEYLSTTQVGTSFTGIILGWVGENTLETMLMTVFGWTHLTSGAGVRVLGSVFGVIILTYLEVVVTEIVPKNIAIDMPLKVLMLVVTPLHWFHTLTYPFVWLLNTSAKGLVKLLGFKQADEEHEIFSQSEILRLSRNAVAGGSLDQSDLVYMQRAFELNDRVAKDIMTDRTSVIALDITTTVQDALTAYLTEGYSRFPVMKEGDKDNLVGYIYAYDIIKQYQDNPTLSISRILRSLITVPEIMKIHDVLGLMINHQSPFVIVVDEYGGMSGIVTDKDIYEELFGSVRDEIDDVSDEYIIKQSHRQAKVSGKTTLYDFERFFHQKLPEFQDSDILTFGGYCMEHFPDLQVHEHVHIGPFEVELTMVEHGFMSWFTVSTVSPDDSPSATPTKKLS